MERELRLYAASPAVTVFHRRRADGRRLPHYHEARPFKVFHNALGDDRRHDLVAVVHTLSPFALPFLFRNSAERLFLSRPNGIDAGDFNF